MSTTAAVDHRTFVSPVQTIFDDIATRFPHDEGEGRLPVPGDYQDANGEWVDIPNIFKVVGFFVSYSDNDNDDYSSLSEPFMAADFLRDSVGTAITVHQRENAEALRRYADEMIGLPLMTVPNPVGSGYMFLCMAPASPMTQQGHALFEKLAAYLNYRNQPWLADMIAATYLNN